MLLGIASPGSMSRIKLFQTTCDRFELINTRWRRNFGTGRSRILEESCSLLVEKEREGERPGDQVVRSHWAGCSDAGT